MSGAGTNKSQSDHIKGEGDDPVNALARPARQDVPARHTRGPLPPGAAPPRPDPPPSTVTDTLIPEDRRGGEPRRRTPREQRGTAR
jgi:hypothetical protein